jgi:hypothetical protein
MTKSIVVSLTFLLKTKNKVKIRPCSVINTVLPLSSNDSSVSHMLK